MLSATLCTIGKQTYCWLTGTSEDDSRIEQQTNDLKTIHSEQIQTLLKEIKETLLSVQAFVIKQKKNHSQRFSWAEDEVECHLDRLMALEAKSHIPIAALKEIQIDIDVFKVDIQDHATIIQQSSILNMRTEKAKQADRLNRLGTFSAAYFKDNRQQTARALISVNESSSLYKV